MTTLEALETLLRDRRVRAPEGSYSVTLVRDPERASRKIMEEAYELCHELTRPGVDHGRVTEEAADLLFHVLAGLVSVGAGLDGVLAELEARRGVRGEERPPAGDGSTGRTVGNTT